MFFDGKRGIDYKALDPAHDVESNPLFKRVELVEEDGVEYLIGDYSGKLSLTPCIEPPKYLMLSVSVDKTQYKVNDIVKFEGVFENDSVNIQDLPITILDRDGKHVDNIAVNVVNGVISGEVTFDKTGDYYITHRGINFHRDVFTAELILETEIKFRVCR